MDSRYGFGGGGGGGEFEHAVGGEFSGGKRNMKAFGD